MGFSIMDCLPETSHPSPAKQQKAMRFISYYDLIPSDDNFYSMQEIAELKCSIELAGRVLHNLVVVPLDNGKYKITSGHRRHKAVGDLLAEGKDQYEFMPCYVDEDMGSRDSEEQSIRERIVIITANSQREKTAWDKLEEVRQMRDLQRKLKDLKGISGGVRELVAKSLHINASVVGKYEAILNNLSPALIEEIKSGKLPLSVAYKLSQLEADEQICQFAAYAKAGKLSPSPHAQTNASKTTGKSDQTSNPELTNKQAALKTVAPQAANMFQWNTSGNIAAAESGTAAPQDAHYKIDVTQLTNNEKRKAVLQAWREWPVWCVSPEIGLTVHKLDLPDGSAFTASWYEGDDFFPGGGEHNANRPRFHLIGAGGKLASGSQGESILIEHLQSLRQKLLK